MKERNERLVNPGILSPVYPHLGNQESFKGVGTRKLSLGVRKQAGKETRRRSKLTPVSVIGLPSP